LPIWNICNRSKAVAGVSLSATKPNVKAIIPKKMLPANELSEPIVALWSLANSFCISVLFATVVTPKKIDVEDMRSGENTVGKAVENILIIRL